jgi:hypothetical protein
LELLTPLRILRALILPLFLLGTIDGALGISHKDSHNCGHCLALSHGRRKEDGGITVASVAEEANSFLALADPQSEWRAEAAPAEVPSSVHASLAPRVALEIPTSPSASGTPFSRDGPLTRLAYGSSLSRGPPVIH